MMIINNSNQFITPNFLNDTMDDIFLNRKCINDDDELMILYLFEYHKKYPFINYNDLYIDISLLKLFLKLMIYCMCDTYSEEYIEILNLMLTLPNRYIYITQMATKNRITRNVNYPVFTTDILKEVYFKNKIERLNPKKVPHIYFL